MVCIGSRDRRKGLEADGDFPVVVGTSRRVAEFESDRMAQRHLSSRSQWRECGGDGGFGQPCENTGVDEISDACHLLVGTPRPFSGFEVEAALLAEQGDELQPTAGMDYFVQSGVDRRPQGGGAEDLGCLSEDILVNLDRCLRYTMTISRPRAGYRACPRTRIPESRVSSPSPASGEAYPNIAALLGVGNVPDRRLGGACRIAVSGQRSAVSSQQSARERREVQISSRRGPRKPIRSVRADRRMR